jgi:beta-1,4-mannosyl-glycoprotein beta-1,4-N-acetylglucosaminyltransferase
MRIYDCFTFFKEFEILDMRLHELNGIIDRFVLVEATKTFTNKPKRLFFAENEKAFSKFADKIIHVIVEDSPADGDAWAREEFQRNAIAKGLSSLPDDALILISDADEVPKAEVVKTFLTPGVPTTPICLRQHFYYYSFRWRKSFDWPGTVVVSAAQLKASSPQKFRDQRFDMPALPDAGWHCSYFGDTDSIIEKIESFSHEEYNAPAYKDPNTLTSVIQQGKDLFFRGEREDMVEVTSRDGLPEYVVNNCQRFIHLLPPEAAPVRL